MANHIEQKQKKKAQWAWYLYDFGNSAYAAVVLLAVYAAYFKEGVVGSAEGSALWGLSLTISMLVVAVISPFLGTLADYSGRKKTFLFIMTAIAVVFTGLLFIVEKGDVLLGMILFIVAEIGYRAGQVFYNSLLVDIADQDEIGKVSGNGWAIGSLGGIICLIIVLVLIQLNPGNTLVVRSSLLITAVYYAIFTLPAVFWIKEVRRTEQREGEKSYFGVALERLKRTIRSVKDFREFLKFILAMLIYNNGVIAALNFAAILGAVLFGVTSTELIIFVIIVQVTNVAGAWIFGILGDKIGFKKSLIQSLLLMLLSVIGLMFISTKSGFFIVGAFAGFAMAGVQSLSRTVVSLFAPSRQTAEFYGFFALSGRTSSIIGPGVMGAAASGLSLWVLNALSRNNLVSPSDPVALDITEKIGHRFAIITMVFFILVGIMPLLFVDEEKGKLAAKKNEMNE